MWRNPDFSRLWAAATISIFGTLVTRTALPFTAILVLHASPLQVALLTAAELLPGLVLGLLAGVWVDRLHRRPILIAADVGRAILLSSIPLAALLGMLRIEQLYLVAFLVGTLSVFFDVAYQSYLPSLVRREELIRANSTLAASASVAESSAFAVGGWLVQWLTAPLAILLDSLTFLGSALLIAQIRRPEDEPVKPERRESVRQELLDGARVVLRDPILRSIGTSVVAMELTLGVGGAVFLLFVTRELGFQPGVLGLIFAVGGVSSFIGALAAGPAARRLGIGPAMIAGLVLHGLGMLLAPLAQGAAILAAGFLVLQQLVADGAATVFDIHQVSLRQTVAPAPLLGRANASIRFAALAASLLGVLIGGVLAESIGLRATLILAALVQILAALSLMLSPLRAVRDGGSMA